MSGEEEPTNSTAQQMVVVNSSLIGRVEEFVPAWTGSIMSSEWKCSRGQQCAGSEKGTDNTYLNG